MLQVHLLFLTVPSYVDPDTDPFDRNKNIVESVRERRKFDSTGKTQLKKKRKQLLNSIVDKDVKRELQSPGTELVSKSLENTEHSN